MKKRRLKKKFKIGGFIFIIILVCALVGTASIYILKDDTKSNNTEKTTTKNSQKSPKTYSANLTFVGDLLFEQPYYNAINKGYNAEEYFSEVKRYFVIDDISVANMEVTIDNDQELEISGTGYSFCAPKSIGKLVANLDFEVLSTANNHSYDRGINGINSTIDFFKENSDILTVGTYKTEEERKQNHIIEVNNIKIGFLSYTLGTNTKVPEKYRNLVGLYRDPYTKEITEEHKKTISEEIANLKNASDVVIVLIHWGKEFTNNTNTEQQTMAKFLNEQGVDIIVGHHSHSIQPIEWIGDEHKTLVYYSLGNFVSADPNITRTGEKFNNAYQFGLLSTLTITKENNEISINNIKTEPIINYFDTNLTNFKLIPLSNYTKEYETTHYRYKNNLTKDFVNNMYETVINEEFRS